jgi:hypothetical protein
MPVVLVPIRSSNGNLHSSPISLVKQIQRHSKMRGVLVELGSSSNNKRPLRECSPLTVIVLSFLSMFLLDPRKPTSSNI